MTHPEKPIYIYIQGPLEWRHIVISVKSWGTEDDAFVLLTDIIHYEASQILRTIRKTRNCGAVHTTKRNTVQKLDVLLANL